MIDKLTNTLELTAKHGAAVIEAHRDAQQKLSDQRQALERLAVQGLGTADAWTEYDNALRRLIQSEQHMKHAVENLTFFNGALRKAEL